MSNVSKPLFLLLIMLGVIGWVAASPILVMLGYSALDPSPYVLLQGVLTLLAVYLSLAILTTQRRAGTLADVRAQVTLQHSILVEHKAAKIIELLEELRRDNPSIANRSDRQAHMLSTPSDPKTVAAAIVESHTEATPDDKAGDRD